VKYLITAAEIDADEIRRLDLLLYACESKRLPLVKYFMEEAGLTITDVTQNARNILYHTSCDGSLDIIKYFVSLGLPSSALQINKGLPLRMACYHGHLPLVKYLVENGSEADDIIDMLKSVCKHAEKNGHKKIVQYIQGATHTLSPVVIRRNRSRDYVVGSSTRTTGPKGK
jgi:ankyrin repeat protein